MRRAMILLQSRQPKDIFHSIHCIHLSTFAVLMTHQNFESSFTKKQNDAASDYVYLYKTRDAKSFIFTKTSRVLQMSIEIVKLNHTYRVYKKKEVPSKQPQSVELL